MKLDLHIHSKYSYDSFSEPSRIVKAAKRKGLDVISITDHDNMKVYEKLPNRLEIIVGKGMEIKMDMGDVTGLFFNISHGYSFIVSQIKRRSIVANQDYKDKN